MKRSRLLFVFFLSLELAFQELGHCGERQRSLPSFSDDGDRQSLLHAIETTREFFKKAPRDLVYPLGRYRVSAAGLLETLSLFQSLVQKNRRNPALSDQIRKHFDVVRADGIDGTGKVLVTGYYEPVLEARSARDEEFRFPLYRKPDDLVEVDTKDLSPEGSEKIAGKVSGGKLIPYPARGEIDENRILEGKGLEIAWTRDPIALFFLHIQGSGILEFENAERRRVHYDGSNGRPYRSIGKLLKDSNRRPADGTSLQAIRRYLLDHPAERQSVLNHNERYIFFRFVTDGPIGNLGIPLIPERSIAIDPTIFPRGALAYITTKRPSVDPGSGKVNYEPLARFTLSHDTGSAIRGAGRVDLFWGTGKEAEEVAGRMSAEGSLHFLVKKGILRRAKARQ